MRKMSLYKKVIVIGCGKIVGKIIETVFERKKDYGYTVEYVEYEIEPFGISRGICKDLGISSYQIEDKILLEGFFKNIKEKCLIISASNNYLFPAVITEDPHYTIINFHNALLPKFPGRNAPSWAIFEGEKETGITWHYVTDRVDGGDIIIQKKCSIGSDIRAYELAEELMCLAYEGFYEKFDEIIEDKVSVKKQDTGDKRRMYRSTDYPANCQFSMDDSTEYIYRLLRAVDYGKYGIFPQVTTIYQQKKIKILRYRKILSEKMEEKPGVLYIPFNDEFSLRLAWTEMSENFEGGVIPDVEFFYELLDQVKRANRKYLSNYFPDQDVLLKAVEENGAIYVYKKNEYLNIWLQKKYFKRMYYFIADPSYYKVSDDVAVDICDVFCKNFDEVTENRILLHAGMRKYATYVKWICNTPVLVDSKSWDDLQMVEEDDGNLFKSNLYRYFDKFSDLLPDENEWDDFVVNKHFIGIHDIYRDVLAAGMVYSKRGAVITEDYVFVISDYRGRGLSKVLHNTLYEKYSSEKIRYIAWIRADNQKSINLHKNYGYKKQNQLKYTFIKSNNI